MNRIEITVLSARVLDALSARGLKTKTVREFERYGTRRIVKHCLDKGQTLYSKETVQNFVWQERARMESGSLPHYQWALTRRAAIYLDQMVEYEKIQDAPIRPWKAEHNPLFQNAPSSPSNSMKVIDIIYRTRDAVMQLELSDKTKTNYIYCGFGTVLNFFTSRGEEFYSPETLALFVKAAKENFVSGIIQKASFQTMRKAAYWIEEYLLTGQVSQRKLSKYNFVYASPKFEKLLLQYQMYMDTENYLKESTRKIYLSSVRTFFRTMDILGIYHYAEITLPDVTRCLAKISETFPLGIFNLTGSMRSFARFMVEKHPELPDISPALVFSAAKCRRIYVGYTHEDAQKIFSAINRNSTIGMRDYAMIMLAYTTGLRGCDIVNLKFKSIDWDACELRLVQEKTNISVLLYCCGLRPVEVRLLKKENVDLVRGAVYVVESKGHKDRVVAVADDLLQIMRSYSTLISEIYPDSDYFFPRYDGDGPYTKRWTEEMFWRCFSMAGITAFEGPKPRVYDFRHTFATECICRWMREGRDIDAMLPFLSAYMGHARYEDTLYYVHMVPDFYERVGTVDRTAWEKLLPEVHDEG